MRCAVFNFAAVRCLLLAIVSISHCCSCHRHEFFTEQPLPHKQETMPGLATSTATAVALAIAIFARAGARSPAAARGRGKGASTGVARTDVESRGGDREIALVSHLGICLVRFARKMNLPLGRVNGRVKKYHKIGIEGVPDFGSIVNIWYFVVQTAPLFACCFDSYRQGRVSNSCNSI